MTALDVNADVYGLSFFGDGATWNDINEYSCEWCWQAKRHLGNSQL
jgi:hypothetical protein